MPFLIVGTHRTGTSALAERLGLHPAIACAWEPTVHVPPWDRLRAARRILAGDFRDLRAQERTYVERTPQRQRRALGFRLLFKSSNHWIGHPEAGPALWYERFRAHLDWLQRRRDIRIVHVVRRDNLAWLRSIALAERSGLYAGQPYPDGLSVRLGAGEAVRRVRCKHLIGQRLGDLRHSHRYLQVEYEAFAADGLAECRRVALFLGCHPDACTTDGANVQVQSRPGHRLLDRPALERALELRGLRYDPVPPAGVFSQ